MRLVHYQDRARSLFSHHPRNAAKGLHEDDLMIQLVCKDESGANVRPVFNLHDDIIRGVLAGINEISEDKALRNLEQVHVTTDVKYCNSCGAHIAKEARFCSSCGQKQ
jgi:hypothetical protein